ncbi:MAG: polyphosphate kinase 1, partial [Verrucomicrobia bacterium]|nr:polyphosphate kinase 1 [Cytophagales bacterium]
GSADIMVRSFDKRIESLFLITDQRMRQQAINVLVYNLKDNQNAYEMQENSNYVKVIPAENETPFNIQKAFYEVSEAEVMEAKLF